MKNNLNKDKKLLTQSHIIIHDGDKQNKIPLTAKNNIEKKENKIPMIDTVFGKR